MLETWKLLTYKGTLYENYEISDYGNIRRTDTKQVLKIAEVRPKNPKKSPYCAVTLGLGSRKLHRTVIIHRAVATNFLENPKNFRFIKFKDKDFRNCSADNLYWSKTKTNQSEQKVRRRANNVQYVTKRRKKLKEMAVDYKGGKCLLCGYNRCIGALEFHHKDPSQKDFGVSSGATKSWEKVKTELDKCVCVCANCHREIHEGIVSISTMDT